MRKIGIPEIGYSVSFFIEMFLRCGNVRIFSNFLMHNRGVHIHSSMCCFSSVPFLNHEHFLKRCTDLIERRGHKFINYGETVIDMDGNPEFFDITYGWPIKHYCKCNFSSNPVHGDEILEFEVSINIYIKNRKYYKNVLLFQQEESIFVKVLLSRIVLILMLFVLIQRHIHLYMMMQLKIVY